MRLRIFTLGFRGLSKLYNPVPLELERQCPLTCYTQQICQYQICLSLKPKLPFLSVLL